MTFESVKELDVYFMLLKRGLEREGWLGGEGDEGVLKRGLELEGGLGGEGGELAGDEGDEGSAYVGAYECMRWSYTFAPQDLLTVMAYTRQDCNYGMMMVKSSRQSLHTLTAMQRPILSIVPQRNIMSRH